jgi:hypothetical protein
VLCWEARPQQLVGALASLPRDGVQVTDAACKLLPMCIASNPSGTIPCSGCIPPQQLRLLLAAGMEERRVRRAFREWLLDLQRAARPLPTPALAALGGADNPGADSTDADNTGGSEHAMPAWSLPLELLAFMARAALALEVTDTAYVGLGVCFVAHVFGMAGRAWPAAFDLVEAAVAACVLGQRELRSSEGRLTAAANAVAVAAAALRASHEAGWPQLSALVEELACRYAAQMAALVLPHFTRHGLASAVLTGSGAAVRLAAVGSAAPNPAGSGEGKSQREGVTANFTVSCLCADGAAQHFSMAGGWRAAELPGAVPHGEPVALIWDGGRVVVAAAAPAAAPVGGEGADRGEEADAEAEAEPVASLVLWEPVAGQHAERALLGPPAGASACRVHCLACSRNGRLIAGVAVGGGTDSNVTAGTQCYLLLWESRSGQRLAAWEFRADLGGANSRVRAVALRFSSDGGWLAALLAAESAEQQQGSAVEQSSPARKTLVAMARTSRLDAGGFLLLPSPGDVQDSSIQSFAFTPDGTALLTAANSRQEVAGQAAPLSVLCMWRLGDGGAGGGGGGGGTGGAGGLGATCDAMTPLLPKHVGLTVMDAAAAAAAGVSKASSLSRSGEGGQTLARGLLNGSGGSSAGCYGGLMVSPDGASVVAPLLRVDDESGGTLAVWRLAAVRRGRYKVPPHDRSVYYAALDAAWCPPLPGVSSAAGPGGRGASFLATVTPILREVRGPRGGLPELSYGGSVLTLWRLPAHGPPQRLAAPRVHTLPVTCVAWSADGGVLASGGTDRALRLWDVRRAVLRSVNPATGRRDGGGDGDAHGRANRQGAMADPPAGDVAGNAPHLSPEMSEGRAASPCGHDFGMHVLSLPPAAMEELESEGAARSGLICEVVAASKFSGALFSMDTSLLPLLYNGPRSQAGGGAAGDGHGRTLPPGPEPLLRLPASAPPPPDPTQPPDPEAPPPPPLQSQPPRPDQQQQQLPPGWLGWALWAAAWAARPATPPPGAPMLAELLEEGVLLDAMARMQVRRACRLLCARGAGLGMPSCGEAERVFDVGFTAAAPLATLPTPSLLLPPYAQQTGPDLHLLQLATNAPAREAAAAVLLGGLESVSGPGLDDGGRGGRQGTPPDHAAANTNTNTPEAATAKAAHAAAVASLAAPHFWAALCLGAVHLGLCGWLAAALGVAYSNGIAWLLCSVFRTHIRERATPSAPPDPQDAGKAGLPGKQEGERWGLPCRGSGARAAGSGRGGGPSTQRGVTRAPAVTVRVMEVAWPGAATALTRLEVLGPLVDDAGVSGSVWTNPVVKALVLLQWTRVTR